MARKIDNVIEESNVTEVDMTEAEVEEALKEDMRANEMDYLNWQMILLYRQCDSMPETYACAVVAATIGECGICGWIRTNKDKQQDRKWQKQDEKEGREQNESGMNVGNIDEEDNL